MDRSLYIAASEGQVDVVTQHKNEIEIQITANCNTALHVAAQFGQRQCAAAIVDMCPSLLHRVNVRGETPLHMAAREGYSDIVKALIECAKKIDDEQDLESGLGGDQTKKMLRATNVDGDTALHMAVRNCHLKRWDNTYLEVARLLTQEDLEFEHPANNAEETPLYLAAERGILDVLVVLLDTCSKSRTYGGPGGKTALHAAALNDDGGELIRRLLQWKRDLIKEVDKDGWTPIHCAAWTGNELGVEELLKTDKSVAYISTTPNKETALHMAAARGHAGVMGVLLSSNPDCWEMVNSRGQNVQHIALEMGDENAVKFIVEKPWSRHLINQKDNEGNTPLHQLISSDVQDEAYWQLWRHSIRTGADWQAFNSKNMTPIDLAKLSTSEDAKIPTDAARFIVTPKEGYHHVVGRHIVRLSNGLDAAANFKRARTHDKKEKIKQREEAKRQIEVKSQETKERRRKLKEEVSKLYQTLVIVAALITTITFAAAFAIPGGYDGNQGRDQGMAVLARAAAFKGFVITNTIAMVCSVATIFLCITAMLYSYRIGTEPNEEVETRVFKRYIAALALLMVAMFVLILVFITASFAVLAHSIALAVSTCIIAGISFLVFFIDLGSICYFIKKKKEQETDASFISLLMSTRT